MLVARSAQRIEVVIVKHPTPAFSSGLHQNIPSNTHGMLNKVFSDPSEEETMFESVVAAGTVFGLFSSLLEIVALVLFILCAIKYLKK